MRVVVMLGLLLATGAHAGKKNKKAKKGKSDVIDLPCAWDEGDAWVYDYTRKRVDSRDPDVSKVRTGARVTITVKADGDRPEFEYDTGSPTFEGPDELVAKLKQMMGDVEALPAMRLRMIEGQLSEVVNREEILTAMEPVLRMTLPADAPPEVLEQTLALFRDPAAGNQLLLKEPAKLFALHCVDMTPGQDFETPTLTPSPFGGPPMKGQSRVSMLSHDAAADTVTFETEDRLDPDFIKQLMPALLERFVPPEQQGDISDEKMEILMASLPPIDNRVTGHMVYSTKDGFPIEVSVTQSVGSTEHPMHRSDTWTWTRRP